MRLEISAIPPAPRRVRWEAVIFRRWPIGLFGILMTCYGSLLTWMFWLGATSSHVAVAERKLDAGSVRTTGVVTEVQLEASGRKRMRYHFRLQDGDEQDGESVFASDVDLGTIGRGDPIPIDYLEDEPIVSRAEGGHVALIVDAHGYGLAFLVAPGVFALGIWMWSVIAARSMLRHGDVAIAEDLTVREIRLLIPTMLEVRFRFRDRQARIREGRHVVTARSRLGRLATMLEARLGVVHDRNRPSRHHLVVPEDFVVATAPTRP